MAADSELETLAQHEVALAQVERELRLETAALQERVAQLVDRVSAIHQKLGEAEQLGADGAPLRDRLSHLQLPDPEDGAFSSTAQQLRRAALAARLESARAHEQRVVEWKLAVEAFDEELAKDLAWVEAVRENARQAKMTSRRGVVFVLPLPEPSNGRQPRVSMQAVVDCRALGAPFTGVSTNLSDGGLFIATENRLPPGTSVDLSFTLPGGLAISATGIARWSRELDDDQPGVMPGIGVQFAAISAQAKAAIHRLVAERATLLAS